MTTNRIVEDTPYYDGRIFHRLVHDFVIQGGSSNGLGSAGSGYVIQDEFHPDLRHSGRYILSMAKTQFPGTGNAQFFITLEATPFLDDKHSVFGEVIAGKDIIDDFTDPELFPTDRSAAGAEPDDPGFSDVPLTELTIDSVTIGGPSLGSFDIHDPALELPTFTDARPIPERDAEGSSFTTKFPRQPHHDYLYSYSLDLQDWRPFPGGGNILSYSNDEDYGFRANGISMDSFYATIGDVDYSFLHNPTVDLFAAGSSITLTSRAGVSLTITSDGAGGGTWSDSNGKAGALVSFSATDGAPNGGAIRFSGTRAHLIPLIEIEFRLDAPGGPANRSQAQLFLDFREPLAGWSDGVAWSLIPGLDGVRFLHAFTVTPAP